MCWSGVGCVIKVNYLPKRSSGLFGWAGVATREHRMGGFGERKRKREKEKEEGKCIYS